MVVKMVDKIELTHVPDYNSLITLFLKGFKKC